MSGGGSSERDSRVDRALRGLSSHEEERAVPGPEIPRYEIRGKAGEGAAAVVYRAWDRELGRPVALKVLKERVGLEETARARFRREAQLMGGVSHPNVVAVHDAGEIDGRPYLVMELVEGRTLAEALLERAADPLDRVRVLEKVSRAVGAAHAKQIVHRDLKPGNILLSQEGEPKVADFGLAHLAGAEHRLTRTGAVLGTPQYMAPEQVEGATEAITPRTDVYALGAILYEMVSGAPPHVGSNLAELSRRIVEDEPARLKGVPADLETVCLKALAKEPSRRYADASAMADDLGRVLRGEPILARPTSAAYVLRRSLVRHRAGVAVVAAVVVALILGLTLFVREALSRAYAEALQEGVAAFERGETERALEEFRKANRINPGEPEPGLLLGRCLARLGREDEALEAWTSVLDDAPDHLPARVERGRLRAVRSFLERVRTIPGDAGWVWVSPRLPWEGGFDTEDLRKAAPHDRAVAQLLEGMVALGEGRWVEAWAALRACASIDPDLAGVSGASAYFARDLEGAERELSRALGARPREEWRRLRGQVRILSRRFAEAEEDGVALADGIPKKGLLLWLRADHGQAATQGILHQWLNQAGGTVLLGPRAGEKEPLWIPDAGGGRPAVRFDGKDQGLGLAAGFDDFREGLTAFVLARPTGPGLIAGFGWSGPDLWIEFGPKDTFGYVAGFANHRSALRGPAPPPATGLQLYEVVSEPSGRTRLLAGGRVIATGDVAIPNVVLRDKNPLGKFPGDLAEILVYRRALREEERKAVAAVVLSRGDRAMPPASEPAPPGGGTGLRAEYYRGTDLSGTPVVRTDPGIRFNWGGEKVPPTGDSGSFSVRWSGRVVSRVTGPVTFSTDTDDGVRLWVDGRLLVNNWTQHSSTRDWETIDLVAGREVDLVMEFYEIVGGANATLSWSWPGMPEQIIPASQLFPRPGP